MIEDIQTLQNMVKKRDEIIADLKVQMEGQPLDTDTAMIDYKEVCIQLKAANGEITRLEEDNKQLIRETAAAIDARNEESEKLDTLTKTHDTCLQDRDSLADDLKKTQKQLDQECDSNAELDDSIADKVVQERDIYKQKYSDIVDEKKLLEVKLATCDEWYRTRERILSDIKKNIEEYNKL